VPLVVMTPKSLLRHPAAVSRLDDLAEGAFHELLVDAGAAQAADVDRLIVCSGKIHYDLLEHSRLQGRESIALVRVEQLYPFSADRLAAVLSSFPHLRTMVWCQEEPRNQGAWNHLQPALREILPPNTQLRYAGPPASSSTAPGHHAVHVARQKQVILDAFASGDDEPT
jgi:2-oxoglutarate dehydrogenase E1 component